jgi:glyoxylase-like metal-dependent hydrolase (beta-lactamase superfamily II)
VGNGILPDLLPTDLAQRCQIIPDEQLGRLGEQGSAYDLWGDGSIQLYALPGHGRGQLGALVQTPEGRVFLAADAAWQLTPWQRGTLPNSIVRLFFDDWPAYRQTFMELRDWAERNPDCRMVFTHSAELVNR